MKHFAAAVLFALAAPLLAKDEFTLYDLLPPESHQFAIVYDVTEAREGAELFFNPIRPGSTASNERVLSRATGNPLPFEVVSGKVAKESGLVSPKTADDEQFIRVHLGAPVPKGGETRIRILKTYTDAASYFVKDGQLVFTRPLGIKRNVVLLLAAQDGSFHRAEQDREISYWLLDPATHQFRISHDFTVTRAGQASVHSFVRKGSVVAPDAKMIDLDTGRALKRR